MVKNSPAMQETPVWFLGLVVETPLELHWGRYSRKDVQAGSCLVAICGTLFSS